MNATRVTRCSRVEIFVGIKSKKFKEFSRSEDLEAKQGIPKESATPDRCPTVSKTISKS
jgi:hypothetical protein